MLRTLVILPDGTELISGATESNAIQSVSIKSSVNSGQELTLGSTCSTSIDLKVITPKGNLEIAAGSEIVVYQITEDNIRHKIGLFTTEKPTKSGANTMSITAYDRVSWLDKDLTQWLASLDQWPYNLYDLAHKVCEACNLELANEDIPNSDYAVQQFSATGITGRQLIQWIGEISGRFCRANTDGLIEFAWYTRAPKPIGYGKSSSAVVSYSDNNLSITDSTATVQELNGNLIIETSSLRVSSYHDEGIVLEIVDTQDGQYYFQNSLSFEDFVVEKIEKIQLKQSDDDVGTIYPNNTEAVNTYVISGNYLLTANKADDLLSIAKNLYEQLSLISFTPCKVSIPSNLDIQAGHIVTITDINGVSIQAYIMSKSQSGQRDVLECTGSRNRESVSVVNDQKYQALTGKVLNLSTTVEGLKVENRDTNGRVAQISLDIENIRSEVYKQEKTLQGYTETISTIEQTAEDVRLSVKTLQDNGVNKVSTEFGLNINESCVEIKRSTSDMTNRLDEKGMRIVRDADTQNETTMFKADSQGVIATDVSVRNYLVVGQNARFEDIGQGRTACFWIGGY